MSKNRRGPYSKTRKKIVSGIPDSFFKDEHEHLGLIITCAYAIDRGKGQIYVVYKILGDKKQHRCPRYKTVYLDDLGLEAAEYQVLNWKNENNNGQGKGDLRPGFYLSHRADFLKYLHQRARHTTIVGYEAALRQYVFPYLVGKLKLDNPAKWNQDVVERWERFLIGQDLEASSRNKRRTALRRYLNFLKSRGIIKTVPQILNEQESKRDTKETIIPGELPCWEDVVEWLRKLPAGRYRFVRAVALAFGLRISEAVAVVEQDFIGDKEAKNLMFGGGFISNVINKGKGFLFLNVDKAEKRKIPEDTVRVIGDDINLAPKSGRYTACCTHKGMAELIIELIENKEHLGQLRKDEVYKINKNLPVDPSDFKFHLYEPHDDRRLNITLQYLDLCSDIGNAVEAVCKFHGQSTPAVFEKYFQNELIQKRLGRRKQGNKLKIIQASGG